MKVEYLAWIDQIVEKDLSKPYGESLSLDGPEVMIDWLIGEMVGWLKPLVDRMRYGLVILISDDFLPKYSVTRVEMFYGMVRDFLGYFLFEKYQLTLMTEEEVAVQRGVGGRLRHVCELWRSGAGEDYSGIERGMLLEIMEVSAEIDEFVDLLLAALGNAGF